MPSYMYPQRPGCAQVQPPGMKPYAPYSGTRPSVPSAPTTPTPREELQNMNNVYTNTLYTQGYLSENVGRYIKAEFLIGTNMLMDREGILKEVGISYIVIQEPRTDDLVLCDLYSIKFVTFFY